MAFRRLEHVPSSYFGKRKINTKGMISPFRASRHMEECEMLKDAFILKEDQDAVNEALGRAFLIAQNRMRNTECNHLEEITEQERNLFFGFYPLMMVRDGALIQAKEILQRSNPGISGNFIAVGKHNLICLYAMLAGKKPASLVSSARGLAVLNDGGKLDFGKDGLAWANAIDTKCWIVSQSEKTVLSVIPSVFYSDPTSAARILGIPNTSAAAFASGFERKDQVLAMLHFDTEISHPLWDSVFVPAVALDGELQDVYVLREWHDCLGRAIPKEAMDLLMLESKIKTIVRIAQIIASVGGAKGIEYSKHSRSEFWARLFAEGGSAVNDV
jgi:hypothetical protein